MATTFTADKVASTVQSRAGDDITAVYSTYAITAAFVINDVVQMCKVPAGATILEVTLGVDALDTSTGVVVAVGDGSTADRFITASTIGRSSANGIVRTNNRLGTNYLYTAEDTIDFKVTTAATGTASTSGNIDVTVIYTMQQ